MTTAGDTLDSVAQAVRDAGSGIREQQPQIAEFAETAASQVERAAEYLRVHDANDLIDEASRFARQQPMVLVGGALLAGLAVGRLLKSSTSQGTGQYGKYGQFGQYGAYGSNGGYGSGYGAAGTYGRTGQDRYPSDGYGTGYGAGSTMTSESRTGYTGGTGSLSGDTDYATGGTSDFSGTTGTDSDMADDTTRTAGGLGTSER
jgi:hypothetical protein